MANSESGSAGTKGLNHGDREQFDHFDRLSQVDQQNLNTDKMKATDKEADIEELLATEDTTHTTSSEFHGGGYKADELDIDLDLYNPDDTNIPPIEEIEDDATTAPLLQSEASEEIAAKIDSGDITPAPPGIVTKATSPFESQADAQLSTAQPVSPTQESIPQEIEEPEENIPVEGEPPESPEPPSPPEPPEPPTPPEPPIPPEMPEPPTPPEPPEPPENPDPDPENCDDHPIPEQQENGNYNIIPGAGLIITIDSLASNAGFNNSFGHYFADANGNPISGQINFANVKDTLGVGEEVTIQYESGDIPTGAVQLGFFLIPNGADLNQISDGDIVTFQDVGGIWTPFVNGNPVQGASTPAFFSDQNLNPDGVGHMSYTPDGELSWEDQFAGGDNDFNDATLNVTVQSSTDDNGRDDIITGTSGDDDIQGGQGDDVIFGSDGDDILRGGAANDILIGNKGDDHLLGGSGHDILKGGEGDDILEGEACDDHLFGGKGDDKLLGGTGDDKLYGGAGSDILEGNEGDDQLEGNEGEDTIKGGIGDDVIDGGEGNDQLEGNEGEDTIKGGIGDDIIDGGDGDDQLEGDDGEDTIKGGIGDDVIEGGEGDDQLEGNEGDDTIKGGIGDDVIDGGSGNDQLEGNDGDDTIKGGIGDDVIEGGEGDDQLEGNDGDDTIKGGKGKDILEGQAGNDLLIGGEGDDLLVGDRDTNHVPAPSQLPNGNYDISGKTGFSVTLDSISSTAILENSFGVYFVDDSGNPISGVVNFANVQDTLGVGDPVTINFAADDIPVGAIQLGFFIIPDGYGLNPTLANGDNVTFVQNNEGEWAAFLNGNELQGDQGAPAYFSDQHLNPDNLDHMTSTDQGQIQVGFEDLLGGGDNDFDDAVVNVTVEGFDPDREENNDTLLGGKGDDTLKGGAGDDILEGGEGDDNISGGTGNDIAIFQGAYNEYNITKNDDGSFTVEDKIAGRDGTDIVDQVEIFQFSDRSMATSEIINSGEPFIIEESSDFSGWSDNRTSTLNQDGIGEFLGRQGDSDGEQVLHKTFDISDAGNTITIEFDMLEIDDWESTGNSADDFVVFVNDQPVLIRQFDANIDDGEQNPDGLENLGFGNQNDEIHHIKFDFNMNENGSLTLLNPDGSESSTVINALPDTSTLKLGFGADMSTGISNESWGIDNVKISSNLSSSSDNGKDFSNSEVVADDTDDWIEAISNGNNLVDSNPSNWLEDIDRESHEHSDPSDHSNEFKDDEESASNDDDSDDSELPQAI